MCSPLVAPAPWLYLARFHTPQGLRPVCRPVGRLGRPPQIPLRGNFPVVPPRRPPLHQFPDGLAGRPVRLYAGHRRDDDGNLIEITLDQQKYIDEIAEIYLEESTDRGRLLNAKETTLDRGLIGALSWCTGQTRPDFSYSLGHLSQRSSKPTVSDALQANKTLQHMRKRSPFIRFPKLSGPVRLIGYHDSSWGNGEEGKTVGG